jgi:hypothetical protein
VGAQHDNPAAAHAGAVMLGADRLTDIAMDSLTVCPACGYPKFGPGLCAFCGPRASTWPS